MNKWQFMILVAVALVAGLIGGVISDRLAMATGKKVIEAEKFRVVDKTGKVRASFGFDEAGPSISFDDTKGKLRVSLGIIGDCPALFLYGSNRKMGAALSYNELGASVSIYDNKNKVRAMMGTYETGPSIELYDANGKTRAALGVLQLGDPKTGSAINRAESSLVLFNGKGEVLWAAP